MHGSPLLPCYILPAKVKSNRFFNQTHDSFTIVRVTKNYIKSKQKSVFYINLYCLLCQKSQSWKQCVFPDFCILHIKRLQRQCLLHMRLLDMDLLMCLTFPFFQKQKPILIIIDFRQGENPP